MFSKLMEKLGRRRVITDRTGKIPYLIRYYVFLKDRKNFPFNVTVHKVLVSDEPTLHVLHVHVLNNILSKSYDLHVLPKKLMTSTSQ